MNKQSFLARFLSIRMQVHPTWYLATILITVILVTQYPGDYLLVERIIFGLLGSLLFLATIAVVSFVHNLVATLMYVSIKNVTLFVFDGVTVVPGDGTQPGREALLAGITWWLNLAAAGIFNWIYLSQPDTSRSPMVLLLQWLAFFWYMLAIFHILPAFPLAGGRLMAAIIWRIRGNYLKSVRFSARIGWLFGMGLSLWGVAVLVTTGGRTVNALLLIFFGWALQGASSLSLKRASILGALEDIKARNIMTMEFAIIGADLIISDIIRDYVLITGQDFFPIAEGKRLLGIITADDIKSIPKRRWKSTSVGSVMTLSRTVRTVSGYDSAAHAIEMMDQFSVESLPVLDNGYIIGILTRSDLERLANVRSRLKV